MFQNTEGLPLSYTLYLRLQSLDAFGFRGPVDD